VLNEEHKAQEHELLELHIEKVLEWQAYIVILLGTINHNVFLVLIHLTELAKQKPSSDADSCLDSE
jgi:hypothetical protein